MPGIYHDKDYDLAGFAVGAVARHAVLPNLSSIQASDVVIGLPSSGIHSNGFSLVRKIVEDCGYTYSDQCPYTDDHVTLGESLLTPTKIYVYSVLPLMKQGKIKAFAHITGKQPFFRLTFTYSKYQYNVQNLFKGNNKDTRTTSLVRRFSVFIVKFEQISHIVLVFPLLNLNK